MDGLTFHALGKAAEVRDLFEGIVRITGDGDYAVAAALLVTVGFILVLAAGAVRADGKNAIPYFASTVLFWCAAVVPTATVVIDDNRSESVYTVDNVPLSVALTASVATTFGTWLAESYETAFVPVTSARFTRFGAVFPERVAEALKAAGPVTPEARRLLDTVAAACVVPEVLGDAAKGEALLASGDVWGTVSADGWVNPARAAALPDGTVAYCPAAVAALTKVFTETELPALKRVLGAKLAPEAADPAAVLAEVVPQAESLLFGLSRSLDASLRHAVTMTAVTEALDRSAQEGNTTLALAVNLAKAQGNLASEINYRTMAKIGAEFLPKVRNSLEIVVIGLFPVTVLLALVSGHALGAVLKSWLMVLAALELWPAAASLVNFLVVQRDAGVFTALINAYGADSLAAAALIRETGASAQAVAGALMMAVPVICYLAVCGGTMAIGQMTASLVAPAQSAAQSQGASLAAGNVAQGNVSLGNVSANSVSANKSDASVRATAASTVVTGSAYGTVTREAGGELTGMSRTGVNLGVTAGAAESIERQQSSQYAAGFSGSETQTVRTGSMTTSDMTTGVSRTFVSALNDTVANSVGHGSTWNQQSASGSVRTASDITEAARMNQVTEGTTVQTQGSWQAGVSVPALGAGAARVGGVAAAVTAAPGLGVRGAVQAVDTESLIDQATGRTAALQSRESREAYQTVHDAAQRIAATHTDAAVRSEAANFLTTLSRRRQAALEKATGLSDTVSVTGSRSESAAGRTATTVDDSASLMAASVARFGSAEGALRALNRAEGRTALATSAQEAAQAGMDSDAFGAGAMASPVPYSEDADAARKAQYRRAAVGAHMTDTVTAEAEAVKARSEKRPSGFGLTEDAAEKMAAAVESRGTIGADETAFRRGLLMIARETYRTENADKNYALRNAFLAGIGYQDTGSLQASLKAKAASDPVLRSAVASVGAKNTSEVGASDWTALVKAARGAVRE